MEAETSQTTPLEIGYRLHELQVLNWGTFHHDIWSIDPAGKSALLTGQNGSGKSTLIDALLTLLVHPQHRGYNLASITTNRKRGERTVDSYVVGEYGHQRDEGDVSKPMRLRDDHREPSVLVAVFRNETGQVVSLAHMYYFDNDKMARFYIVASIPLDIKEHFQFDGNPDTFRKHIQALGGKVSRDFAPYASEFKARFGLVSDNALKLFNSIVSMKDIGKLTDFIRDFMLEQFDSRSRLDKLYKDFENLTTIYQNIVLDRRQLQQLEPIAADNTRYQVLLKNLADAKGARDTAPAYFADQRVRLLDQAIADSETQLAGLQQQQDQEQRKLEDREAAALALNLDLNKDDAHRQLLQLKEDKRRLEEELRERQDYARQYDSLAKALGLPLYADQDTFHQAQQQADALRASIEADITSVDAQIAQRYEQIGQIKPESTDIASQISALSKTKSSLPPYLVDFRASLSDELGIQRAQMPFVGELIKVRDDAGEWEAAIEKLLRGFAQFMLVPQHLYGQVRELVNTARIGGRLSYYVVRASQQTVVPPRQMEAVYHKLEFYPQTAREFLEFVQISLSRQSGDYVCVDSPAEFDRYDKALTRQGQIKHSRERHEKDDRRFGDRSEYVLGWDNTAKKQALEVRYRKLQTKIQALTTEVQGFEASKKTEQTRLGQIERFLSRDFKSIDWQPLVELIDVAKAEIETLERASDHAAALRAQLNVINAEIAGLKNVIAECNAQRGVLQRTRADHVKDRATYDRKRQHHPRQPGKLCGANRT